MIKNEWVKIGEVGVDSGSLIICDPCYIDSEWEKEELIPIPEEIVFPDGHTEKVIRCSKRWFEIVEDINKGLIKLKEGGGFEKQKNNFSYTACANAISEKSYGQLNFKLGHSGCGVVFESGLGDGTYEVFAKIGEMKMGKTNLGKRIKEVRIKLI